MGRRTRKFLLRRSSAITLYSIFFFKPKYLGLTNLVYRCSSPTPEVLHTIYHSILIQSFKQSASPFSPQIIRSVESLIQLTLELHAKISQTFLPTAAKFHYVFHMEDLANLFQVRRLKTCTEKPLNHLKNSQLRKRIFLGSLDGESRMCSDSLQITKTLVARSQSSLFG